MHSHRLRPQRADHGSQHVLGMTRALTVICLALVAGLSLSAHAMGSARELADDCRSLLQAKTGTGEQIRIPFTKKALVCWGYMQAMQDLSVLADEDGRRIMGSCPSQRATLLELIQAFVSYARSHELPDNAALAVTRALQEAYPCKARQGFRGLGGAATFDCVSPLLDTGKNICSRWEAVNNALSSISGESCIGPLREL
jgi:Rap1a immunity proteins